MADNDDTSHIAREIYALKAEEERWWKQMTNSMDSDFHNFLSDLESFGMNPNSIRYWGEIAFLLLGLKPCMTISEMCLSSIGIGRKFMEEVVNPWLIKHPQLEFRVINRVHTKLYDFSGHYVVFNRDHFLYPRVIEIWEFDEKRQLEASGGLRTEDQIAFTLDYPSGLPDVLEGRDQMIEVGYFQDEAGRDWILMSFGVPKSMLGLVHVHFERYKKVSYPIIKLKLIMNAK